MRKVIRNNDKPLIIKEGKYLRLIRQGGWEFSQRANCTGIVVIIAMTVDKKVILIKQFRPPVNRYCIEFPAGLVNDRLHRTKESMATAARRELLEETGYKAQKIAKVLTGPVSPGSSADLMTLFLAEGLSKVNEGGGDHTEDIEVCEVPFTRIIGWLKKMEHQGCLVDPKVYAGLYFLKECK
jgi:ADP-ribose pyrophosphatase